VILLITIIYILLLSLHPQIIKNIFCMKTAYVFPGQGAQFSGMGKDMYVQSAQARDMFDRANALLGFSISDIMFSGSDEDLKQTKVTQPAIFLHSVVMAAMMGDGFRPDMAAGHSLGEFSALVACKALSFDDGLLLVSKRAKAMQKACESEPSIMAAIIGLDDSVVEEVCRSIDGMVVAANYNCPGQLVISGTIVAVDEACEKLKSAGAKLTKKLPVGGAFHSPLMAQAHAALEQAICETEFAQPVCPIYQNVTAQAVTNPDIIKTNLIAQLTSPVRWTQSVLNMIADGAADFIEIGPGKVLQGLVKKTNPEARVSSFVF